jgi:hypothetical protein
MVKAPKILKRSKSRAEDGGTADEKSSNNVPNVAIKWLLDNSCTSNVQLAIISNVCRGWRQIVIDAVASEALEMADSKTSKNHKRNDSTLRGLIVVDMARSLVMRQRGLVDTDTDGSFCLAWFAPSGIQLSSVLLDDDSDESDETKPNKKVTCCNEWRGYTHATEVMIPIGYATNFIHEVFETTSKRCDSLSMTSSSSTSTQNIPSYRYNTTFSVRGAVLARPEGYCLCMDSDYIEHTSSSNFQKPAHVSTQITPSCVDEWMLDYVDEELSIDETQGLSSSQRAKKRRDLGRVLLPRVIMSTRRKYPLLHRFAETDEDCKSTQQSTRLPRLNQINARGSPHKHLPFEKRQRAVQFLNSDRSQATRMITPNFDCGSVSGPITAFLVAISTEDGCFFSGRSCRYECGHMNPICSRDMQNDMSPVCIATGNVSSSHNSATKPSASFDSSSEDDVDSSSFSDQSMHCLCKFDSQDPFQKRDGPICDDATEDCTYRGKIGPGLWHVYVAVFDGVNSILRVDGSTEPKQTREDIDSDDGDIDDGDRACNSSKYVGHSAFDGLTIGSDHQFDLSLCYGDIEGETGQG